MGWGAYNCVCGSGGDGVERGKEKFGLTNEITAVSLQKGCGSDFVGYTRRVKRGRAHLHHQWHFLPFSHGPVNLGRTRVRSGLTHSHAIM